MEDPGDDHILIHPRRGRADKPLPARGLLLVNPVDAVCGHQRWREEGGEERVFFNSGLTVDAHRRRFIAGPAIGAPMAAIALEKTIVLGAEEIVLFGWCGGLSAELAIGDVLIPSSALAGEGTSAHYPHTLPLAPSSPLCERLGSWLGSHGLQARTGKVWSTDAIFREDRRLLGDLHRQEGVVAVDMEFSALCAVAAFRRVKFAAILVVSDHLSGPSWRPGFTSRDFLGRKSQILELLLQDNDNWSC